VYLLLEYECRKGIGIVILCSVDGGYNVSP